MSIIRVAVNNNFNCTTSEWIQLNEFAKNHPDKTFFVNSNINTPALPTIKDHPYKAVVTVNPNILIKDQSEICRRLMPIKSRIAFVRVKYVPDHPAFFILMNALLHFKFPVVITLQRFNGKKSLSKYANPCHYEYSCSRFRLKGKSLDDITSYVRRCQARRLSVWICDEKGLGCSGCGLCSKLVTGKNLKIYSLNLSSSGICPYNCPDCYAKTMQNFCRKMGYKPIIYDSIRQNGKQAGRTVHIKENQNAQTR